MLNRVDGRKEVGRFLIVGISSVAVDFLSYLLLKQYLDINLAKGFSFLLGSVNAYVLNNYWTFKSASVNVLNIVKFSTLYSVSFILNVFSNFMIVITFGEVYIAFLFATVISTIINYLGQKFWVFKK